MESRSVKRGRRLAAALLIAVAAIGIIVIARARGADRRTLAGAFGGSARAPEGTRVKVEVLNATHTRGLARRATRLLRDRGFDVVELGTTAPRDSTVVFDRSGHPEWARLVAEALGGARVESRPDSSRYLDVTVLLGASWRAPPGPLYP